MSSDVAGIESTQRPTYNARMKRLGTRVAALSLVVALLLSGLPAALAETGLPLPRFASLRSSKVHLRTGPGVRYPVEWVFVYRSMPVEIVAEYENWRKVRDWQGAEGWVHRTMLSGTRTAIVRGGTQPVRREPDPTAPLIARVEEKVVGRIIECTGEWCRVEFAKKRGWIRREHIWGVYGAEKIN